MSPRRNTGLPGAYYLRRPGDPETSARPDSSPVKPAYTRSRAMPRWPAELSGHRILALADSAAAFKLPLVRVETAEVLELALPVLPPRLPRCARST